MRGRACERYLGWAFCLALLLHGLALAGAARLPAGGAGVSDLEEIQVFDSAAPMAVSPVDLVELAEAKQQEPQATVSLPTVPETRATRELPVARVRVEAETMPQPKPNPAPRRSLPKPRLSAGRDDSGAGAAPMRKQETGSPGGGGGGGWVGIGSRSSRGDLSGLPSGGTPVGGVPGTGTGSGGGTGPDSGSGTGGGSGSGAGAGTGSGQGPGTGSGGEEGGSGKPFVSKTADRAEPVVVAKGTLKYPPSAQEEGIEGTVRLKVLVVETGSVAEVEIDVSSGDRRLDAAAKQWVQGWRYRPAAQNGKPRRVQTYATVEFELR